MTQASSQFGSGTRSIPYRGLLRDDCFRVEVLF